MELEYKGMNVLTGDDCDLAIAEQTGKHGLRVCHDCRYEAEGRSWETTNRCEWISHLWKHRADGDRVPLYVLATYAEEEETRGWGLDEE